MSRFCPAASVRQRKIALQPRVAPDHCQTIHYVRPYIPGLMPYTFPSNLSQIYEKDMFPSTSKMNRGSNNRGRGVGLSRPSRGRGASQAANTSTTSQPESQTLTFTLPVAISLPSIKQYQAFLRQHAWITVKQMPSMRVGLQKKANLRTQYAPF
jgi:hypothetical protein